MRLGAEQLERLRRAARRLGRTPSETSAQLLDEALRRLEFALVDFRDSPVGRQAYVQGTTLAVWEVVSTAQEHGMDLAATAAYLDWPPHRVQAALNYAMAFQAEINMAIADNDAMTWTDLTRLLPAATERVMPPDGGAEKR
jgi:hypothetical protein